MVGGKFDGWEEPRKTNAVYRIHFDKLDPEYKKTGKRKKPSGKYFKIYERGPDNERQRRKNGKPFWKHSHTDRVRIEFTFNRRNATMASHGIRTLKDLLAGPKFQEMIFPNSVPEAPRTRDQIQFKNFIARSTNGLPKPWEDYTSEDHQGNFESFMEEYFNGKRICCNIARETEIAEPLIPLKNKIVESTINFDKSWR